MKKAIWIFVAVLSFLLTGCQTAHQQAAPTTEASLSVPAQPSEASLPMQTEDVAPDPEWLMPDWVSLSYEEYFSCERPLEPDGWWQSCQWCTPGDEHPYSLYRDDSGFYVSRAAAQPRSIHRVPNGEQHQGCGQAVCDGKYAYCVQNGNEILRIALLTGETEVIFEEEYILDILILPDHDVLYFVCREEEDFCCCRLYLPTMTLDVLYDQIPNAIPDGWFMTWAPETNLSPIGWRMMNPEFYPVLQAVLENPDSPYRDEVDPNLWEEEDPIGKNGFDDPGYSSLVNLIKLIQYDFGIPPYIQASYDFVNDVYSEKAYFLGEN